MKQTGELRPAGPEPRILCWEGEPVLTFFPPRIKLPPLTPRRVAAYYRRLESAWLRRWEVVLYRRACAAAGAARSRSRPFEPWSAALTAELSEEEGVLLVRWTAAEMVQGRRGILSREDRWQLPGGTPLRSPNMGKRGSRVNFL